MILLVGLATTISSVALVGVAATGGTLTIFQLMTAAKLKLGVVSAVIIAVVFIAFTLRREGNNSTEQNRLPNQIVRAGQSRVSDRIVLVSHD